ncbi:phage major capsid protein [Aneurinibacillus aneurinilyticus]|nr:phage major capsid protein [Aneurinibacillus aneurinilyticus]MED0705863.1 phage major capsid protein [Aneurinibacillus aneurinilyticus]MED0722662.1 phage major capsid protein [Aneurinibacillus aneurinilyticus]MED0731418.1 phage major capsid protein [Aneurinibacillus aneurinilyticus]MED0740174.1 phage major capsid protein [Aneurinibacillus aneurinilyticus]
MTANSSLISKEQQLASIRKSVNLVMPKKEAEAFLVDTLKMASTLPKLRAKYTDVPSSKIPKLKVKSRQIREHTGDEQPTGTGSIDTPQVPYSVRKVYWDEWIKDDDVWYNNTARGDDVETKTIDLVQGQFSVDIQDLLFNGDADAKLADGTTPDPFLSILDGFVKKMKASTIKTALGAAEPTIDDFVNHVLLLDEKYLNMTDLTWIMNRRTYQKLVALVQKRPTTLGDVTLVNGKLTEIAGYPIEVVQSLQSGFVALTPLSNLVPVFTRDLRYKRTADGATAAIKDSTYHILFAYADAVVLELEAVAWMSGDKL